MKEFSGYYDIKPGDLKGSPARKLLKYYKLIKKNFPNYKREIDKKRYEKRIAAIESVMPDLLEAAQYFYNKKKQ